MTPYSDEEATDGPQGVRRSRNRKEENVTVKGNMGDLYDDETVLCLDCSVSMFWV